jgi:hypothetical protein
MYQCIPRLDVFELFPFIQFDFLYQLDNKCAAFLVVICVSKSNAELICNRRRLDENVTLNVPKA